MTTSPLRQLVLAVPLCALAAMPLRADPAPWYPGDPGDRLAVVATVPGDEVRFCGGLLQECDTLDLPAHVFFAAAPANSAAVRNADAALARPPDSFDLLRDPSAELPALLPAFAPSHLVLTQPTPALLDLVAAAFPDPAAQPMLLVPSGDSANADWLFSLTPAQSNAKNAALRAYGLPPATAGDSEPFLELEFDPLAAAISAANLPVAPPASASALPPPPHSPATDSASPAPSASLSPARLRPRTHLPATLPPPPPPAAPSSWADEIVRW